MLTDATVHGMLDNQFPAGAGNVLLSLHSAFSTTGAGLIGSKTSANFAAAASRAKNLAADCDIAIAGGNTVKWIGAWDSTGATFRGMQPNGGNGFKSFQVDLTNNRIYCEGHGWANDQKIIFDGTPPTGLTEGTTYFVVGVTAGDPDYFQVAATQGGAAIDITGQQAAGCNVSNIVEETYSGAGSHKVTAHQIII